MNQRPTTSSRPLTSGKPIPGTSTGFSRMQTAGSGPLTARPMSRTNWGPLQGRNLNSPITVADRPMTQHGLGGLKTGIKSSQRVIQDKTYFMGLLRTKISELNQEINGMARESETLMQGQATYRSNDKKAANLALDIKKLQEELGDYNMLADKQSTDTEIEDVKWECEHLRLENEQQTRVVEDLYAERREKEEIIAQLETEMNEEKVLAANLISNMKPELREKHSSLNTRSTALQQQINTTQLEMDGLESTKLKLEHEIAASDVKQEAFNLYEKIRELEAKQEALMEEERLRGTPAQEREKLLKQVKEDNQEMSTMEKHIKELKDQISKATETITQLEEDLEATQSEKNQQYLELRKREEMMDQFLNGFDESQTTDIDRKATLERSIVELLEKTSFDVEQCYQLPTMLDLHNLKDDLVLKENDLEKSKSTKKGLLHQQQGLKANLQKMGMLENKMKSELTSLKEKIETMKQELVTFENIDDLRLNSQTKETELNEKHQQLLSQTEIINSTVSKLQAEHDTLKKKLQENEAHIQLENLEKKWKHLEQNNFMMKEFIASKNGQSNYKPIAKDIEKQLAEYNSLIQARLSKR